MATTTPNFGWTVPTSSDLVKNGAVAIETLGDAIDASLVDLKGGTTGQVLAKASGTDMDFTWTTTGGGGGSGLVFIKRVAFSAVSSTTTSFDSVFTSAYESYLVVCESIGCSSGTTGLQMLARVGGTSQTSLYYGNSFGYNNSNTLITRNTNNASNFLTLWIESGGYYGGFALWFESVGNTSEHASWHGTGFSTADTAPLTIGGKLASSVNVDGFLLQGGSGTITGAVSVYGLAKS